MEKGEQEVFICHSDYNVVQQVTQCFLILLVSKIICTVVEHNVNVLDGLMLHVF